MRTERLKQRWRQRERERRVRDLEGQSKQKMYEKAMWTIVCTIVQLSVQ